MYINDLLSGVRSFGASNMLSKPSEIPTYSTSALTQQSSAKPESLLLITIYVFCVCGSQHMMAQYELGIAVLNLENMHSSGLRWSKTWSPELQKMSKIPGLHENMLESPAFDGHTYHLTKLALSFIEVW